MKTTTTATLAFALLAVATSGCLIDASTTSPTQPTTPGANRAPIISSFDYSPKTGVTKSDAISFTVVANDLEGDPLQYNWTSTKGTLSGNSGQTISWRPTRADGTIEPGLTTVNVVISDGRQTSVGSVNIQIDADGHATVQSTNLTATPSTPAAAAPPSDSAPAATTPAVSNPQPANDTPVQPAADSAASTAAIPGHILFQNGFDGSGPDFSGWAPYNSYGGLQWKVVSGGAEGTAGAAIVNDAEDEVKASTSAYNTLTVGDPLDLTNAKQPRVKFWVKNTASPGSSVSFHAVWSNDSGSHEIAPAFNGTKDWSSKDFNLAPYKGAVGKLVIEVSHSGSNARYSGALVDDVTVYDASGQP